MVLMSEGIVSYYSGQQTTTALCTAMAETIALAKLAVKVKYIRAILSDLQFRQVECSSEPGELAGNAHPSQEYWVCLNIQYPVKNPF